MEMTELEQVLLLCIPVLLALWTYERSQARRHVYVIRLIMSGLHAIADGKARVVRNPEGQVSIQPTKPAKESVVVNVPE